jgi:hypothetical protein
MAESPIREPDQLPQNCALKLRAVQVSDHFGDPRLPPESRLDDAPDGRNGHRPGRPLAR